MKTRSQKFMEPCEVGEFVALAVPAVDLGPTDAPNLICEIIEKRDELYRLACEAGILDIFFARNAFNKLACSDFNVAINKSTSIGVRAAVASLSLGNGQGMVRCSCTQACATNRCQCKKLKLLCNSRCHGGNNLCKNK
jgi:hypothetical protein